MVHIPKPRNPLKKDAIARYNRILRFIQDTIAFRGEPPKIDELKTFLNVSSIGTVNHHLKRMEDLGLIERSGTTGGQIKIPGQKLKDADKEVLREMKKRYISLADIIKTWREL